MEQRSNKSPSPKQRAKVPLSPSESFNWDDLRVFLEVAGQRGLSAASKSLGQPKSTLSRRLKALESQLGLLLFQRSTRRFELTSQGETLFRDLAPLALELRRTVSEAMSSNQTVKGRLRMTAPFDMGSQLLPAILSDFETQHPEVELELIFTDRIVDLIGERFDLALRAGKMPDSNLKAKLVGQSEFRLFASPNYLKENTPVRSPKDLLNHRGLVFSGRASVHQWTFSSGPLKQRLIFGRATQSTSLALLTEMACRGRGISVLPTYLVANKVKVGELDPVLPDWSSGKDPIYLVYPPYRQLPKRLEVLIRHLWTSLENLRTPLSP